MRFRAYLPFIAIVCLVVFAAPDAGFAQFGVRRGRDRSGSPNAAQQSMNCEQVAAQSRGAMSVESCKQMDAMRTAMTAAANDPSAQRPGDDKMTCDQIVAEIKQQRMPTTDAGKLAAAQTATGDYQKKNAEQQKEAEAIAAKESAELSAATRFAPTNAAGAAAAARVEAEQKATNERMSAEMAPVFNRMFGANIALTSDFVTQIAANPRLARLAQFAVDKHCSVQ